MNRQGYLRQDSVRARDLSVKSATAAAAAGGIFKKRGCHRCIIPSQRPEVVLYLRFQA